MYPNTRRIFDVCDICVSMYAINLTSFIIVIWWSVEGKTKQNKIN